MDEAPEEDKAPDRAVLFARAQLPGMDDRLRAGIAVYNAGFYHAAHDAWEDEWLDLPAGTDDEELLHGLIQFTAAVYHAREGNWAGATGLAESAGEYLASLPATVRGVDVGAVRTWLDRLERDPELLEREGALAVRYEGRELGLADLEFPAVGVAAPVLAGALDYDVDVIERARTYAEQDLEDGRPTSPFVSLVVDFARETERDIVVRRLTEHVERRDRRRTDVDGLFDEE